LHANAALIWSGRRELARRVVEDGWTLRAAAEAAGISVRCARKWVSRYRAGDRQLRDRSSAPGRAANRTPADRVVVIVLLRQLRMTAVEIAETLQMPLSTVSVVLKRQGMGRLRRLGRIGLEQPLRYERSRPGELVHVDVKTRAVAFVARYGIQVERVLTDNGSCYRGVIHAIACKRLGIRHLRTRPHRPQTDGKAERFIRTLLHGWAYGPVYGSSREGTQALDGWLWHYNHRRPHSALDHQPPANGTNLLGPYIWSRGTPLNGCGRPEGGRGEGLDRG
jgi:transposase InsO family protein